jgi:hypothetical protein
MPLTRLPDGRLLMFAHVPKCAGTSVEHYLEAAFGPLALLDRTFNALPQGQRWSKTSPQHVDAVTLRRLFPPGFLAACLAVVRHPVARILSVFRWQRDIEGTIAPDVPFGDWLDGLTERPRRRWAYDNHVRPMTEMVPDDAAVFRLEDGWDPVIDWLQALVGPDRPLPRVMPERNNLERRLAFEKRSGAPVQPGPEALALITQIYAADFARFGYPLPEGGAR